MPGTMVLVMALVGYVPRAVGRAGGSAWAARVIVTAAWAGALVNYTRFSALISATRTVVVAPGTADEFRADRRGTAANAVLEILQHHAAPGETVLVIPEGLVINYLARRPNPVGHLNFTPPALVMYGERRMLADVRARPPEFVVLVHVDTSEYGSRFFGQDYGLELAAWVAQNYQAVARVGATPFTSDQFGMLVMRRNDLPAR
jgi:type IV secretory pathway protease TraF